MGKGRLQGGQRLAGVGRLEDLGDGGPGVQGAAPGGLGVRLGPLVARALGQLAPVQGDRAAAGGQPGLAAGVAGFFQRRPERLQIGADQGGVEAVAAGGVEDLQRLGQARRGA